MKLPKKIRGIHIWCATCSIICSNPDRRCKKQPHVLSKNCQGVKKYQSRIWNPILKQSDITKIWDSSEIIEVIALHNDFKTKQKESNYGYKAKAEKKPITIVECAEMFLDWMQDIDVPEHEKKNLSIRHIKRTHLRLSSLLEITGKNIPVNMVDSGHVGKFHEHLLNVKKYKAETYNGYMDGCKHFFNYLINVKKYDIVNPFENVKSRYVVKKVEIITEEEFDSLINAVVPENGMRQISGRDRNLYFEWLIPALKLARLTGARREELMILKWEHVGDNYITVPNIKVNRSKKVEEHSFVPITQDLAELLLQLKGDGYLIAPEYSNRATLTNYLTTCFSHFWEKAGYDKTKSFKYLRKTYITRIRFLLGDKAKALNNHSDDEIQRQHYIDQQEIQKELVNTRLF